jgi:outer membrane lipoprotein-sorting protein
MVRVVFSLQEDSKSHAGDRARRAVLAAATLILIIMSASCASLVKSKDYTIPKLLTPLTDAKFDDLIKQLQPFTDVQSLSTSQAYMLFTDATASEKYRFEANLTLILQRPDKIRMLIHAPFGTRIADMVSESNRFRVAIYTPSEYQQFLIGTNDADYSAWLEKLKGREKESALSSARPFHFTEALMMRPISLKDPRFVFGLEETLVEEADTRPGAKRGARILRSFYVISELEASPEGQAPARVRRKFWFDRTNGARFARQQIFDNLGQLATEVQYSDYQKFNSGSQSNSQSAAQAGNGTGAEANWPGVIWVNRPHDGYNARLTFNGEKFQINPELKPAAFMLENTENFRETDLDKPEKKN